MISSRRGEKGFTLTEVVIAMAILSIASLAAMSAFYFLGRQNVQTDHRAVAVQKAIQMMEELRGLISNNQVGVLDDYDDGSVYNPVLTTDRAITDPAHPFSGNGGLKMMRRISVQGIADMPGARRVFVRVYRNDADHEVLAETMSILRTLQQQFFPTQAYDIYVLHLENVPGWWTTLSSLQPMFDNVVADLETRNPGLNFNVRYIRRLSFGRDPYYTPYLNWSTRSHLLNPSDMRVYYYPGSVRVPQGGNTNPGDSSPHYDIDYYNPSLIGGRINVDGSLENPSGYSMADQFNHAVRYPDEDRLYKAMSPKPEISLRMLLERMNNPDWLDGTPPDVGEPDPRNAIIVNLHGELMPLPPMRNYSDAAKDPGTQEDVRAVTHPENINYGLNGSLRNSNPIRLRVYSYLMDPNDGTLPGTAAVSVTLTNIGPGTGTGVGLGNIQLTAIQGGAGVAYTSTTVPADPAIPAWFNADNKPNTTASVQTRIVFPNSPLRHPVGTSGGLAAADRLYGLEYIPCQVGAGVWVDLTSATVSGPKNTARYIITIPADRLPRGMYVVETRLADVIADDFGGSEINEVPAGSALSNMSRTYFWVGPANDVPVTEQFQFLGDPRHLPYADVKGAGRYNWYFTNQPMGLYAGFGQAGGVWDSGGNHNAIFDVPGYYRLLRQGLMSSNAFFSTLSGYSFYYYGMGGEMGYTDAGADNGIFLPETAWVRNKSVEVERVNEIHLNAGDANVNASRIIASTDQTWYTRYWLGELYPDNMWDVWTDTDTASPGPGFPGGNLPIFTAGSVSNSTFYRADYRDFAGGSSPPFPFSGSRRPVKRLQAYGCASFFNNWSYNHQGSSNNLPLAPTSVPSGFGTTLVQDFNILLRDPISSSGNSRPFVLGSSNRPPQWNVAPYNTQSVMATTPFEIYYRDGTGSSSWASGLVRAADPTNARRVMNVLVNGLPAQGTEAASMMSKLSLVGLLRGFLSVGATYTRGSSPSLVDVPQLPRVAFTNPPEVNEISRSATPNVTIQWESTWKRWDNQPYTSAYSGTFVEDGAVSYDVDYSADNGTTWTSIAAATTATSTTWNVSSPPLAPRTYIIRVRARRPGRGLHAAFHMRNVYLKL